MKNGKAKLISIINITFILLVVTFSFAWIIDYQDLVGNLIGFNFGTNNNNELFVAPDGLEIELFIADEQDIYHPLDTSSSKQYASNLAPGDIVKYSMRLKNTTKANITCQVSMTNIKGSIPILGVTYVGLFGAFGFENNKQEPAFVEFNLKHQIKENMLLQNHLKQNEEVTTPISEGADDIPDSELTTAESLDALFIQEFTVPPTAEGVEIRYYARIDTEATNTIKNDSLNLGLLSFLIL